MRSGKERRPFKKAGVSLIAPQGDISTHRPANVMFVCNVIWPLVEVTLQQYTHSTTPISQTLSINQLLCG